MRPRFLLPLLFFTLTLAACDSSGSVDSEKIDGLYQVSELQFNSGNSTIGTVNVLSYVSPSGAPSLTLDLLGRNRSYTLQYRLLSDASSVRRSVQGGFKSERENQITVEFNGSDARMLLLPEAMKIDVTEDGSALTATISNYAVDFADLARLDPSRFNGLSGQVRGTLTFRASRQ